MKDKIILESIRSLQKEGLRFSVDTLAGALKISKKTIYKFFPDKESLAIALYDKYYTDAKIQAEKLVNINHPSVYSDLLNMYFDSKMMIRGEIFNKFKLNEPVYSYAVEQNDVLWQIVSSAFCDRITKKEDMEAFRIIVDGSFEKLCNARLNPDAVIERLVRFL